MERIMIRHLNGSKAHQSEEFSLKDFTELTVGRDPSSVIHYDLNQEDLVSRHHAKIIRDASDAMEFCIIDLGSKNGTYVNHEKISGPTRLVPGAVVQLGTGGPEFQFDLDPRPQTAPPPTRVAQSHYAEVHADVLPPTRVEDAGTIPSASSESHRPRKPVGLTTIQRLIGDKLAGSETRSRKYLVNSVAAMLGVMVLVAGVFVYLHRETQQDIHAAYGGIHATEQRLQRIDEGQTMIKSPALIAEAYGPATVQIAVSWKLVSAQTGGQVYHHYEKGMPAYVLLSDGTIEPWLVLEGQNGNDDVPIGSTSSGSGFVVTENGFILTNRHVAAKWLTRDKSPLPGNLYVFKEGKKGLEPHMIKTLKRYEGNLANWIPAKSQQLGGRDINATWLEGRHEYLKVTFANSNLAVPANLVRVSNEHDVALIKIETPQALKKVEIQDTHDETKAGDPITILGYPAISSNPIVITQSQDPFHRLRDVSFVPNVTVTPGVIGKVIRGKEKPAGRESYEYLANEDSFQLTANATGRGNSGGPVFDERGKAIGIFYAGRSIQGDASISFAVPIKYGMDLMKVVPVLK